MDLTATKAVVLVLLGLIKLLSGLAPLVLTKILKKRSDRFLKKFIGIVLCFGGGVLLSTVLLHMLREVRESVERATTMGMLPKEAEYPFAELIIGLGFLLILLIESAVHKIFGGHGHSHFPSQETLAKKFVAVEDLKGSLGEEGVDNVGYQSDGSPGHVPHVYTSQAVYNVTCSSDTDTSSTQSEPKHDRHERKILSSLRSILLIVALSIHSLFEGMAIGLEESDSGVWKLLMAVSIHAAPIVFCVGTDMISSGVKKIKIIIYMIILSINTPIGIFIGIIVTIHMEQASGEHILVIGVLQGLAAGTLLYITFFEVLARYKLGKYGMSGLLGALAVILGFSVMAAMEAAGGHSHGGHGHSHGEHLHDLHHHEAHDLHHHEVHDHHNVQPYLHDGHLDVHGDFDDHELSHGEIDHDDHHLHYHEYEDVDHDEHKYHDHNEHDHHEHNKHSHEDNEEHSEHEHDEHHEHKHGEQSHEDHEEHSEHEHDEHHEHKHGEHSHEDHEEHSEHEHDEHHEHKHGEHSHEEHEDHSEHEHARYDYDDHDGHMDHSHEDHSDQEQNIDHDEQNYHDHEDHSEDEDHHDHDEHEDHDHNTHDNDNEESDDVSLDIDHDNVTTKSEDYFEYNVTDYKFLHDNVAYD